MKYLVLRGHVSFACSRAPDLMKPHLILRPKHSRRASQYHNCWCPGDIASPGHQQPWYWLCKINGLLSSRRKYFNFLLHLSVEQWQKIVDLCFLKTINHIKIYIRPGYSSQLASSCYARLDLFLAIALTIVRRITTVIIPKTMIEYNLIFNTKLCCFPV